MRAVLSAFLLMATLAILPGNEVSGQGKKGKKGARDQHFHGLIVKFHHSKKDKRDGSITVLGHEGHPARAGSKAAKATRQERTFHFTEKTVFEHIEIFGTGKGAKRVTTAGGRQRLRDGAHIHVLHHNSHAVEVKVTHHHKKKN